MLNWYRITRKQKQETNCYGFTVDETGNDNGCKQMFISESGQASHLNNRKLSLKLIFPFQLSSSQ